MRIGKINNWKELLIGFEFFQSSYNVKICKKSTKYRVYKDPLEVFPYSLDRTNKKRNFVIFSGRYIIFAFRFYYEIGKKYIISSKTNFWL